MAFFYSYFHQKLTPDSKTGKVRRVKTLMQQVPQEWSPMHVGFQSLEES